MKWAKVYKHTTIWGEGLDEWQRTPRHGVLFVKFLKRQADGALKEDSVSGFEYYIYDEAADMIYGTNDLTAFLLSLGCVDFGGNVSDADFETARRIASGTLIEV